MVRGSRSQIGIQESFSRGRPTVALWFDRHKNRVDLREHRRGIRAEDPAPIRFAIHIKDPETDGARLIFVRTAPNLEGLRIVRSRLLVQVKRIEDERFPL